MRFILLGSLTLFHSFLPISGGQNIPQWRLPNFHRSPLEDAVDYSKRDTGFAFEPEFMGLTEYKRNFPETLRNIKGLQNNRKKVPVKYHR